MTTTLSLLLLPAEPPDVDIVPPSFYVKLLYIYSIIKYIQIKYKYKNYLVIMYFSVFECLYCYFLIKGFSIYYVRVLFLFPLYIIAVKDSDFEMVYYEMVSKKEI